MGYFSKSSANVKLNGSVLTAECQTVHGSWETSSFDLNKCICNKDGKLVWDEEGNFSYSCEQIWLKDNHILKCKALTTSQNLVDAEIDLDEHIDNTNGQLCFN